ncbi:MAG: amidohydrolase [Bacteroidota bacterium]
MASHAKTSKLLATFLFFGLLVLTSCEPTDPADIADEILTNGSIYTADAKHSVAEALAIKDGRIVAVGTNEVMREWQGAVTKVTDLEQKLVLPGLHDVHVHPIMGAESSRFAQLTGLFSEEAILTQVAEFARKHPDATVIRGRGWEMSVFEDANPHKSLLDAIIPDKPVILKSWDGHNSWVNSKALEMSGVTAETPDPKNGRIERDPVTGEPTGTLRETAMRLTYSVLPERGDDADIIDLRLALQLMNELGITSMNDAAVSRESLVAYRHLDSLGELTVRTVASLALGNENPRAVADLIAMRDEFHGGRLNAYSVKVVTDGVPEARTAAMLQPYLIKNGAPDYGILNFPLDVLTPILDSLDEAGFQIHVHALGDKAVRVTLDAMEGLDTANRHQLSHLQVVHPDDIPRFGKMSILANFQPFWAKPDPLNLRTIIPLVGVERSRQMYPMGSVERTGGKIVAGSDWPVSTLNPWHAIQVGVTRKMIEEDSEAWIPEEGLSLASMIDAYTRTAAYAMHQEENTGSLEVGKFADLIVLDQNIFEIDPMDIHKTEVLRTVVEGETVYEQN